MSHRLWDTSLTFMEKGKAEDAAGNWSAAAILYSEGIEGLQALSEVSKRKDILGSYETIVAKYSQRLVELQQMMRGSSPVTQAPASNGDSSQSSPLLSPPPPLPPVSAAAAPLAKGRLCMELAVSADESGVQDAETVKLYVSATELYMQALKLEPDEGAKAQHRAIVTKLLERAEALRNPSSASGRGASGASPTPALPTPPGVQPAATTPTAARPAPAPVGSSGGARGGGGAPSGGGGGQLLGNDEKEVLARSSTIAGKLFYPYMGDGQRERFHFDEPWEDPDGLLPLSAKQVQHLKGWARPSDFIRGEPTMIYLVSSMSITQTIITDCSFVSSLVIAAAYERRSGRQLITNIIFPQDRSGKPIYNPSGKYLVKLHINGIARKVPSISPRATVIVCLDDFSTRR